MWQPVRWCAPSERLDWGATTVQPMTSKSSRFGDARMDIRYSCWFPSWTMSRTCNTRLSFQNAICPSVYRWADWSKTQRTPISKMRKLCKWTRRNLNYVGVWAWCFTGAGFRHPSFTRRKSGNSDENKRWRILSLNKCIPGLFWTPVDYRSNGSLSYARIYSWEKKNEIYICCSRKSVTDGLVQLGWHDPNLHHHCCSELVKEQEAELFILNKTTVSWRGGGPLQRIPNSSGMMDVVQTKSNIPYTG